MNEFKRRLWLIPVLAVCLLPQAVTLGDMSAAELGYCEETTVLPDDEEVCPGTTLLQNDDGSFENGYAWRQEQVQPPDYGAWAECYEAEYVCGVQLVFTQIGGHSDQTMDVYIWDYDADGNIPPGPDPGNVLSVLRNILPENIAFWPYTSSHNVQMCCATDGLHFVGFWGNWLGQDAGWYIAADEDGPPSGWSRARHQLPGGNGGDWQPVFSPYAPCTALGIREYSGISNCHSAGVPDSRNRAATWGSIKSLY